MYKKSRALYGVLLFLIPATTKRFAELKETEGGLEAVSDLLKDLMEEARRKARIDLICEMISHDFPKDKLIEVFSEEEYSKAEEKLLANV
ncbi:MAG: hypothetical protein K2K56_04385 [Lachnospiraceae bacterium]|nr:hypothetical protein [Lachnospiraceae bacterium]